MDLSRHFSLARFARRNWPVFCTGAGSSATMLVALEHGYQGDFYPLSTILHHPSAANAAFGYRMLLPWIGLLFQHLVHSLTDHSAFIATQVLAIAAAVIATGECTNVFWPRFGRLFGYVAVAVMVSPTLGYWNFYDVGIVATWAGCLLVLERGHYALFVALLAAGTLNHENTLLLVPCTGLYCLRRIKLASVILFVAAQLAAWVLVRMLMIRLVPAGAVFDSRISDNLHFWRFYNPRELFFAGIALLPWWGMALLGWKHSPYLLKCASLSLPGLFLVTFLFGKFDEARQFVAFVPVCTGFIACWLRYAVENPGAEDAAARPLEPEVEQEPVADLVASR